MRRDAPLGTVSVVMIARAARVPAVRAQRGARNAAARATIRSTGSGSMMTPVENGSTASAAQPSSSRDGGASSARASSRPRSPVPALALPALIEQRARGCTAEREMLAADDDGRRAEAILREHAGARAARQRAATSRTSSRVQFLMPRRRGARARRRRTGKQLLGRRRSVVDRHGSVWRQVCGEFYRRAAITTGARALMKSMPRLRRRPARHKPATAQARSISRAGRGSACISCPIRRDTDRCGRPSGRRA